MPWWAIVCAIFFGAVTVLAGTAALASALRFFRRSARVASRLEPRALELERTSEVLAARSEQLAASQARLTGSRRALDASVAKLRVLGWALEDVRFLLGVARSLIPTK
jgi:hypothetical protein